MQVWSSSWSDGQLEDLPVPVDLNNSDNRLYSEREGDSFTLLSVGVESLIRDRNRTCSTITRGSPSVTRSQPLAYEEQGRLTMRNKTVGPMKNIEW